MKSRVRDCRARWSHVAAYRRFSLCGTTHIDQRAWHTKGPRRLTLSARSKKSIVNISFQAKPALWNVAGGAIALARKMLNFLVSTG